MAPKPQIGQMQCDRCPETGVAYDSDGEWLCEDCIFSDAVDEAMPGIVNGDHPDADQ